MESTGIPHGVHETLLEESPWSPCGLLEMLDVVLLKSMESPQSPHGLHGDCGNMWGSVKYSVCGRCCGSYYLPHLQKISELCCRCQKSIHENIEPIRLSVLDCQQSFSLSTMMCCGYKYRFPTSRYVY